MNLARAQKALLAIQRREKRPLHFRRPENEADVREMVAAGLINASPRSDSSKSGTLLGTLTEAGRRFLEVFPPHFRFCDAG